ncbi:MAG: hypothetical protein EBV06_04750 [Planctomycetia bacterium]|nr:hypothetical protein [Planctomycetia bacterium]
MRRSGITLVEVLAAIGIMGIGMLAILVLFPLGALTMARALKDDRCGTIAPNAHALAVAMRLGNDPNDLSGFPNANDLGVYDNIGPRTANPPTGCLAANPNGPGYPVFVDPFYVHNAVGVTTNNTNPTTFLVNPTIPRVSPIYIRNCPVTGPPDAVRSDVLERFFAFRDDLTFLPTGYPKNERQGLYTWAYLLRRLISENENSLNMTVVVYSGRPIEAPTGEETYAVDQTVVPKAGDTSITINWVAGQTRPTLRRGNWLLDTTYSTMVVGGVSYGYVNAQFYRVMDVSDPGVGNQLNVEVQPPLQLRPNERTTQVTWLSSAVEVFERGNVRP